MPSLSNYTAFTYPFVNNFVQQQTLHVNPSLKFNCIAGSTALMGTSSLSFLTKYQMINSNRANLVKFVLTTEYIMSFRTCVVSFEISNTRDVTRGVLPLRKEEKIPKKYSVGKFPWKPT